MGSSLQSALQWFKQMSKDHSYLRKASNKYVKVTGGEKDHVERRILFFKKSSLVSEK